MGSLYNSIELHTSFQDFEKWWYEKGSGFAPCKNEDIEEFTKRVSRTAWLNATVCPGSTVNIFKKSKEIRRAT